jgi:21S rRNA (GM2251-2'-O)-methyltransferase
VDGVVLSTHCAPLSPVVLKASAGAAEALPLYAVHKTGSFIQASRDQGWKFFAAAPSDAQGKHQQKPLRTLTTLGRPLAEHPCVLMLGGEGPGLWQDLIQKADYLLTIFGHRAGESGVDSLNVSVAAALACDGFMRAPHSKSNSLWD